MRTAWQWASRTIPNKPAVEPYGVSLVGRLASSGMVSFSNNLNIYTALTGSVYHDEILNDLRRPDGQRLVSSIPKEELEKDKKAGNGRYAIPRGGLFQLVSFPNYLCEWSVIP